MCLLWRVRLLQYNIGLPGPRRVRWVQMERRQEIPRGGEHRFFPIYRVFFFILLSEKLTNSETDVHNTTLITLHNAIISVAVFVAARTRARDTYNTILLLEEIVIASLK